MPHLTISYTNKVITATVSEKTKKMMMVLCYQTISMKQNNRASQVTKTLNPGR